MPTWHFQEVGRRVEGVSFPEVDAACLASHIRAGKAAEVRCIDEISREGFGELLQFDASFNLVGLADEQKQLVLVKVVVEPLETSLFATFCSGSAFRLPSPDLP